MSIKKPYQHNLVPINSQPPSWVSKLPKALRRYAEFRLESNDEHDYFRGRARAELNWPMKIWSDIQGDRSYEMTISELEEYYGTPKDGVDFMYDSPAGASDNPLIIEQGVENMYMYSMVFCKGLCAPHVPEKFRIWKMQTGPQYQCLACGAHMRLEGKEDVMIAPHQAPLAHEEAPPFEYLEREFEFWMKRGFPLSNFAPSQY